MSLHVGPVFGFELKRTSRRWQFFAFRALLLLAILLAVAWVWRWKLSSVQILSHRTMTEFSELLFYFTMATQVTLVLAVAPALTASAISEEKVRGRLVNLFATDLTDREIVLGKLFGRFLPVLALILSPAPMFLAAAVPGFVSPEATAAAFLVMLGLGLLASAIAFFFSVWGTKTHEILLATYIVGALIISANPVWSYLSGSFGFRAPPTWLQFLSPYTVVFLDPSWASFRLQLIFIAACVAITAILMTIAILRIRSVAISQLSSTERRVLWFNPIDILAWIAKRLPGPSIDRNPLLWREWRRVRPSRFATAVATIYFLLCIGFTLLAMQVGLWNRWTSFPHLVNDFQVGLGMLLVAGASVTLLGDERAGSTGLDVLLVTPLSTQAVIEAKWWAAFRLLPLLLLMPVALASVRAALFGGWLGVALIAGLVFVQGAFVTTIGLAFSVWTSSVRRAMIMSVAIYLIVSLIGLLPRFMWGDSATATGLSAMSPFVASGYPIVEYIDINFFRHRAKQCINWSVLWIIAYTLASIVTLVILLISSDRCLGRAEDRRSPFHLMPARRSRLGRHQKSALAKSGV
jgi:ABC-type transport system involved in multi-copper enzyme maturation permease subunit